MINTLQELYYDQLRDLYSAETQILDALREMVSHATDPELREAFGAHLEETHNHVERLRMLGQRHGFACGGNTCEAIYGLIREAKTHVSKTTPGNVRDAALIASANRIEHYEIAGYGVAKSFADCLGFDEDRRSLEASLHEESQADQTITKIATGGLFRPGVNDAAS